MGAQGAERFVEFWWLWEDSPGAFWEEEKNTQIIVLFSWLFYVSALNSLNVSQIEAILGGKKFLLQK